MIDPDSVLPLLAVAAFGAMVGVTVGLAIAVSLDRTRRRHAARTAGTAADTAATGSTVRPVPAPAAPPVAPSRPATPPLAADVLVVDDSAVARVKLRRLLEGQGYTVHHANDGIEALALLDQGRYALMISDLEMPNMDGVTLINTCLTQPHSASMPILAISGHDNLRARFNACRDICGVHRKPWVDDVLTSHVATLVGTRTPAPGPARGRPAVAENRADVPVVA